MTMNSELYRLRRVREDFEECSCTHLICDPCQDYSAAREAWEAMADSLSDEP